MNPVPRSYKTAEVVRITGFTPRILDYWARTGLVVSSVQEPQGPGTRRLYSLEDVVLLRCLERLRMSGWSTQMLRVAVRELREFMNDSGERQLLVLVGQKATVRIYFNSPGDPIIPGKQQTIIILEDLLPSDARIEQLRLPLDPQ